MCIQCMMGAMSAGAAASGSRAWLATRVGRWSWMTAARLRLATRLLLGGALLASALVVNA